jgi:hypothetical protein
MSNITAFQAMGKTYKANATTTTQTITIYADSPCNQLLVANHDPSGSGGFPTYFNVSSNASITCTAPSNGSAQYALVSVPGQNKVFTIPGQFTPNTAMYIAFITDVGATGAVQCYFTPGEGL